jgi:hypothetical protein
MQAVRPTDRSLRIAAFALLACCSVPAFAGQELMDVETRFRAKIAKEKIRAAAQQRKDDQLGRSKEQDSCGSQNIGNVESGAGPAPREVFVFAPNAINIVGRGGCR